jgi:hypothetical protein
MHEIAAHAVDFSADADLISFLKAIPDGRYPGPIVCPSPVPDWFLPD